MVGQDNTDRLVRGSKDGVLVSAGHTHHAPELEGHGDVEFVLQAVEVLGVQMSSICHHNKTTSAKTGRLTDRFSTQWPNTRQRGGCQPVSARHPNHGVFLREPPTLLLLQLRCPDRGVLANAGAGVKAAIFKNIV